MFTLEADILHWLVSVFPIILLLVLMIKLKFPAFKAALLTFAVVIITSFSFFGANIGLILIETGKALWSSLSIVLVVFSAILISEVSSQSQAFAGFEHTLKKITPNQLLQILGIAMVFASFLQGVTGFGVPIAVTAPLLVMLGVKRVWAVVLPMLGHDWAGTFGTLGVAWVSLVNESGITGQEQVITAIFSALLLWLLNFISGLAICWFYGGVKAIKKGLLAVIVFSLIQGGGEVFVAAFNGVLATFLPACFCLIAFIMLARLPFYQKEWACKKSSVMEKIQTPNPKINKSKMTLFQSFFPYIVMTALTLGVLLIPPIKNALSVIEIAPSFAGTQTRFGFVNDAQSAYSPFIPLTHPSFFLFISALAGYFYYRKKGFLSKDIHLLTLAKSAVKKSLYPAITVCGLTAMSKVLSGTGQLYILALGVSNVMGRYYALLAPLIGMLGALITSSNMSSNILFSGFQINMANILGLSSASMLAGQTAGGSAGTLIAPSNISIGTVSSGIKGQEGEVLKKTLPIAVGSSLLFGVIIFLYEILI